MIAGTQCGFDEFIGIDWSGAKGSHLKKVKVALCVLGTSVPELVLSKGENWRRDELIDWIINRTNQRRILVGVDFSFAYPYCDKNAYFPGYPESPESAQALWQAIENICKDELNFYGGPFYKDQAQPFSQYLLYHTYKGPHFDNNRLRRTEKACELMGTRPTCSFKCVGPDQVGSGTAAGMRVLRFLTTNNILSIWPFNNLVEGKSILVEIFPRLFFILAKKDPRQFRGASTVNAVLQYFGSSPLRQSTVISSEDESDAIISAAALRGLSSNSEVWQPPSLNEETRLREGWIFGSI